jgi:predicted nucleic acid-binding protein
VTLYLDTSSLVKLYVHEAGSDAVRQAVSQARVVATSVIAYAEMRAALARIRRHGGVTAAKFTLLKREFEGQWPAYLRVEVTHTLCQAAGDLAEQYGLRGFDSIHLASFSDVARSAGIRETRFSSFDDRLNDAAEKLTRALERARQ